MTRLVEQILTAAGPMPDPAAHARYLESLSTEAQKARLAALLLDGTRPGTQPVRFWRVPADRQTTLNIS